MRLKMLAFALAAITMTTGAQAQSQDPPAQPLPIEQPDEAEEGAPAAPVIIPAATPAPDPENTLVLDLSTGGRVLIRLRPELAPNHVERIKTLARQGFYDGIIFHRVIDGFMAQTGDPTGTGMSGSQLPDLAAEFNRLPHARGAVAMARANEPNSANSQFYIMFAPRVTLDENYTVFGRVTEGMQYVDAIPRGEPPAMPGRIVRASIQSDNVPPPTAAEVAAAASRPMAQPSGGAASAIDAALSGGATPPPEPAPAEAAPPSPGAQATEAMDAADAAANAAQNDTGTAADTQAPPPEPVPGEPVPEPQL